MCVLKVDNVDPSYLSSEVIQNCFKSVLWELTTVALVYLAILTAFDKV